jgi:hypothetical protein
MCELELELDEDMTIDVADDRVDGICSDASDEDEHASSRTSTSSGAHAYTGAHTCDDDDPTALTRRVGRCTIRRAIDRSIGWWSRVASRVVRVQPHPLQRRIEQRIRIRPHTRCIIDRCKEDGATYARSGALTSTDNTCRRRIAWP